MPAVEASSSRAIPRDHRHPAPHGRNCGPDPLRLAAWRDRAEARLEDELARFDDTLLRGEDVEVAARRTIDSYLGWTRLSVASLVSVSGARPTGVALRASEAAHWEGMAAACARAATVDPGQLDNFLRLWLATVHEATAAGFGSLYAAPAG